MLFAEGPRRIHSNSVATDPFVGNLIFVITEQYIMRLLKVLVVKWKSSGICLAYNYPRAVPPFGFLCS